MRAYRAARVARLTGERGWLTLIGKVWLREGGYTIGADARSDIVLPEGRAPARLGTVTLASGKVRLEVEGDAEVFARGALATLELRSDAAHAPDDVTVGSLTLQLLQRGEAFALRIRDTESAARRAFPGIPAYTIDLAWRIVARFEPFAAAGDGDRRRRWPAADVPFVQASPISRKTAGRCDCCRFSKNAKSALHSLPRSHEPRRHVRRRALSLRAAPGGGSHPARLQQVVQPALRLYSLRGLSAPAAGQQSAAPHRSRREATDRLRRTFARLPAMVDVRPATSRSCRGPAVRFRAFRATKHDGNKGAPMSEIAPVVGAFVHVEFPMRIVHDAAACSDCSEPSFARSAGWGEGSGRHGVFPQQPGASTLRLLRTGRRAGCSHWFCSRCSRDRWGAPSRRRARSPAPQTSGTALAARAVSGGTTTGSAGAGRGGTGGEDDPEAVAIRRRRHRRGRRGRMRVRQQWRTVVETATHRGRHRPDAGRAALVWGDGSAGADADAAWADTAVPDAGAGGGAVRLPTACRRGARRHRLAGGP